MNTRTVLLLVSSVAAIGAVTAAQDAQAPVFRSDNHTVALYATVRDRDGRLVTHLTKGDFQVSDRGQPAPITVFSNETQPITVVPVLDLTGSMGSEAARVKRAALSFVNALWPADRARFCQLGTEVSVSPFLTGDKDVLTRIVREEVWKPDKSLSTVWTTAWAAMSSLADEPGRRVVLMVSDGVDRCRPAPDLTCVPFAEVKARVAASGFMFYAVDLAGASASSDLKRLAEDSGGGHHSIASHADLGAALADIVDELHHQYVIGFTPSVFDGKEHAVALRVPAGMTASVRKSYVAEAGQ